MSVSQLEDFDQCCRCCLIKAHQLKSLFEVQLAEMLSEILNVKVEINDGYPAQMCVNCIRKMTMAVNFKRQVLASYEKLRDIIKNSNNTLNNATEAHVVDISYEEKQVLAVHDDNDINNSDEVEDLNNEADSNDEGFLMPGIETFAVVVRDGHELTERVGGLRGRAAAPTAPPSGYVCPHCGKWFKWRTSLCKHVRTHDGRLYRCRACRRQYADSYYLRIHERKHSRVDGKPFACRLCASRFADGYSLKRHEKRSHPRSSPTVSRAGTASPRGNPDLR